MKNPFLRSRGTTPSARSVSREPKDSIRSRASVGPPAKRIAEIQRQQTPARPPRPQCENRDCNNSNVQEDNGQLVCQSCGFILQEIQITQELTFGEAANGAAVVQGAYVGTGEEGPRISGMGSRYGNGMTSRQISERTASSQMNQLMTRLHLAQIDKDRGMQVYKLAMAGNMVQGRTIREVAAACLLVGCRREKECQIMLIDISEALELNVFKLGQTYRTIVSKLQLKKTGPLYEVDPEHLIQRFARDLEFGRDEHRIVKEAILILQRMKRDWIYVGRRPAGVCGAALILAARMNNYRRTVREVVYTAKVADVTINKRLDEFTFTDSSKFTVDEFRHHGWQTEKEHDPPSFYRQFMPKKKRSKRKRQDEEENNAAEAVSITSSAPPSPEPSVSPRASPQPENLQTPQLSAQEEADRRAMPPPSIPIDPQLLNDLSQATQDSGPSASTAIDAHSDVPSPAKKRKTGRPPGAKNKPLPEKTDKAIRDEEQIEAEMNAVLNDPEVITNATETHRSLAEQQPTQAPTRDESIAEQQSTPASTRDDSLVEQQHTPPLALDTALIGQQPTPAPTQETATEPIDMEEMPTIESRASLIPTGIIIADTEFESDPEVRDCLLSPAEQALKEQIWVSENGDWLLKVQAQQIKNELAERNGTAHQPQKRVRRRARMGDMSQYQVTEADGTVRAPNSPAEAATLMMEKRSYSKKINYDAIKYLFSKDSSSRSPSGRDSDGQRSRTGSVASSRSQTPFDVLAPGPGGVTKGRKKGQAAKKTPEPKKSAAKTASAAQKTPEPRARTQASASPGPSGKKQEPKGTEIEKKKGEKEKGMDQYAEERRELDDLAKEGKSKYDEDEDEDEDDADVNEWSDDEGDGGSERGSPSAAALGDEQANGSDYGTDYGDEVE